jgi:kynureninase
MVSFYRPQPKRYRILCEWTPFPSDRYALQSQADFHASVTGAFDARDALIELKPAPGSHGVSRDQVLEAIEKHKNELALVLIGGVNYYTGQRYDMAAITRAAHPHGIAVGFDLAHAAGNVPLRLHDWNVDFAVWCSYKYLNAGPGSVGGAFVHQRHLKEDVRRFAGWWGNDPATRFTMPKDFVPVPSADAWQLSNTPVLSMASLRASLSLFAEAGMDRLAEKSRRLTGYLEFLLRESGLPVRIITPSSTEERGCQLSLIVTENGKSLHRHLTENGVAADWREPDVLRLAPVPLYNSFEDAFLLVEKMKEGVSKAAHAKT